MNVVATVSNSLGQEIASAQHPFFIVDNEISIAFATDKAIYRPGRQSLSRARRAIARTSRSTACWSRSPRRTTTVFSELVDLPAGGTHDFTASFTAVGEGTFLLFGVHRTGRHRRSPRQTSRYEVATPVLFADLSGPDVAGADPFTLELYLSNNCALPVTVSYSSGTLGAEGELTLEPWKDTSLFFERTIAASAEFVIEIAGDVSQTVTKTVSYGLAAQVQVSAAPYYPEGRVNVPYRP